MTKKHHRVIPPDLLHRALSLLGYTADLQDPQQALIDLLDNFRFPDELRRKTQLSRADCAFICNLRDIATSGRCKTKN